MADPCKSNGLENSFNIDQSIFARYKTFKTLEEDHKQKNSSNKSRIKKLTKVPCQQQDGDRQLQRLQKQL